MFVLSGKICLGVNKLEIKQIDDAFFGELIDSNNKGRFEPPGLFLFKQRENRWLAIDNENGEAWNENFDTKELAEKWLRHEIFVDEFGNILTANEADVEDEELVASEVYPKILDKVIEELTKNDGIGSWQEAVNVVKKMKRRIRK